MGARGFAPEGAAPRASKGVFALKWLARTVPAPEAHRWHNGVTPLAFTVRPVVTAMWIYVNYPNPHFTVHHDPSCRTIQTQGKPNQHVCRVSMYTLGDFLSVAFDGKMRFAAQRAFNDVWLKVKLDTPEQEIGLVHVLQAILGRRYSPLAGAPIEIHC